MRYGLKILFLLWWAVCLNVYADPHVSEAFECPPYPQVCFLGHDTVPVAFSQDLGGTLLVTTEYLHGNGRIQLICRPCNDPNGNEENIFYRGTPTSRPPSVAGIDNAHSDPQACQQDLGMCRLVIMNKRFGIYHGTLRVIVAEDGYSASELIKYEMVNNTVQPKQV